MTAADPLAAVAALPGVSAAAGRARDGVDALLAHRVLRRSFATVPVECSLRAAVAAAALAGSEVPLEQVRDAVRAGTPFADATVRGAVRVSAEVGSMVTAWERAPLQVLARLHAVAAGDVAVPDLVGRPRPDGVAPEDPLRLGPAPPAGEVRARLDALAALLLAPTAAPGVVVAAVVHGELLALRPFARANVVVALAASRLVLAGRGVDPRAVTVPEAGHLEAGRDAYAAAARGYAAGTPAGVAAWLVCCARALEVGAREGLAVCETVARAG